MLALLLESTSAGLGVENVVPPSEGAGVVSNELLVVEIVVLSASPEGKKVVQAPWELISAVSINGLEETADNPEVHGKNVQVLGDQAEDNGDTNGAEAQDQGLNGGSVFCGQTERSGVLVVDLVDVLVQRTPVEGAVHPVVPCVLEDEEDGDLEGHLGERRERHAGVKAARFRHGVEEPDLGEFYGEVAEQDELGAFPLVGSSWDFLLSRSMLAGGERWWRISPCCEVAGKQTYPLNLVLVKVRNLSNDHPRDAASKVNNFVHGEAHNTSGKDIVLHVCVPALWWWNQHRETLKRRR